MALAGPQCHALRVTRRGGGAAQRGGEVVDLGVGGGRVAAVFPQEPVDEGARGSAGEGAGLLGADEEGVGQCLLVQGVGAGLVGGEEGGAELGRAGAGGEDGGDLAAAHQPAGGEDGQADGLADPGEEGEQSDAGAVVLGVVAVGALVAAGLDALGDHAVGAALLDGEGLLGGGGGGQDEGAGAVQGIDGVPAGGAEVEGDDGDGVVEEDGEFGLVAVVAAAVAVAELRLVPGGLAGELVGVDLDGRGVAVLGLREEEVHAEGAGREAADLLDLLVAVSYTHL